MGRDIMDMNFLGPRIMDKFVLALIVMSLYWKARLPSHPSIHSTHVLAFKTGLGPPLERHASGPVNLMTLSGCAPCVACDYQDGHC